MKRSLSFSETVVELPAAASDGRKRGGAALDGYPLLLSFEVAPPDDLLQPSPPPAKARIACSAASSSSSSSIDVVAETPHVRFCGSTSGDVAQLPARRALGVVDRSSGRVLALVELPPTVSLRQSPLGKSAGNDDEDRAGDEGLSYAERKQMLTDAFGSKRHRVKAKQAAASALPHQLADVDAAATAESTATAAAAAAAAAAEDAAEDLPPLHSDGKTPGEAYPLEELVSFEAWERAQAVARLLAPLVGRGGDAFRKKFDELSARPVAAYVDDRLDLVQGAGLAEDRLQGVLAALWLANLLVAFDMLPLGAIRTEESLARAAKETLRVDRDVALSLAATFLEVARVPGRRAEFKRTTQRRLKLGNHVVLLAMAAEGWALASGALVALAKDLRMLRDRVVMHLERVGAKNKLVRSKAGDERHCWVLPVPVQPSVRVPKPSKRSKKQ